MMENDLIKEMTDEELARWLCLLEGSDFIFSHLEEQNISVDAFLSDNNFLKKVNRGLNKFIKEKFQTMLYDVKCFKKRNGGTF